jgi:hypothetical protein
MKSLKNNNLSFGLTRQYSRKNNLIEFFRLANNFIVKFIPESSRLYRNFKERYFGVDIII